MGEASNVKIRLPKTILEPIYACLCKMQNLFVSEVLSYGQMKPTTFYNRKQLLKLQFISKIYLLRFLNTNNLKEKDL